MSNLDKDLAEFEQRRITHKYCSKPCQQVAARAVQKEYIARMKEVK